MEDKVRRNLGDKTVIGNQRYNQALIRDTINEGYLYYVGLMMDSGEGDFAEPAELIDIVAQQSSYDLNTLMTYNPVRVRLVERLYSTLHYTLDRWEKTTGVRDITGVGSGQFFPSYRFIGTSIEFNQIPNFSQTDGLRIEGYKVPVEMTLDTDEPNPGFSPIYHQMLVLYATVSCIEAKEATGMVGDPEKFRIRLAKLEKQFIDTMNDRAQSRQSVDPFITDFEAPW
jgi:hypothetical protein